MLVEGNAELTPARLVGHFDPALVLSKGYQPDAFVDGPLIEAMRSGGLLYVEELNRVPEETLNVLLTVMSEGEIAVPRLGRVPRRRGFSLVAAMNPYDAVGTARISSALYDRTCRIAMGYQSENAEQQIVATRAPSRTPSGATGWSAWCGTPASTRHPRRLVGARRHRPGRPGRRARRPARRPGHGLEGRAGGGQAALTGRIRLHESSSRTPEEVVTELYEKVFGTRRPDLLVETEGSPGAR